MLGQATEGTVADSAMHCGPAQGYEHTKSLTSSIRAQMSLNSPIDHQTDYTIEPFPIFQLDSHSWVPDLRAGSKNWPSRSVPKGRGDHRRVPSSFIRPFGSLGIVNNETETRSYLLHDVYSAKQVIDQEPNDQEEPDQVIRYVPGPFESAESRCVLLTNLPSIIESSIGPRPSNLADILDFVFGGSVAASALQTLHVNGLVKSQAWITFFRGLSASSFVSECQRNPFLLEGHHVKVSLVPVPTFPLDTQRTEFIRSGGTRCLNLTCFPSHVTRGQLLRDINLPTDMSHTIVKLSYESQGSIRVDLCSITDAQVLINRLQIHPAYSQIKINFIRDPCEDSSLRYSKSITYQSRKAARILPIHVAQPATLSYDDSEQHDSDSSGRPARCEGAEDVTDSTVLPKQPTFSQQTQAPKATSTGLPPRISQVLVARYGYPKGSSVDANSSLRATAAEFISQRQMCKATPSPTPPQNRTSSRLWLPKAGTRAPSQIEELCEPSGITTFDFANSRVISEPLLGNRTWDLGSEMIDEQIMRSEQREGLLIDFSC